jgi:hypothetical protein
MVLACTLAAVVFLFVPRSLSDPDIWWHLRDAQLQIANHAFITHDVYSFTAYGAPWMNHEWIAELPFYLGWRLGGPSGIYWVTVIAVELIFMGVFVLSWLRSRSWKAAAVAAVIATALSTISFGPRTLLFGWLCLIAELLVLEISQQRPRIIWVLPLLFVLWVNTHGSWMIGLVLWAVSLVVNCRTYRLGSLQSVGFSRARLHQNLLAFVLSVAGLFVNPYGWRLVAYPFNLAFQQKLNVANVEEWRSLDFHSPRGLIVLASLAGLALWQLWRSRSWSATEIAYLGIGIYSAFNYSRFLFLFAILVAPILARSFGSPEDGIPPERVARQTRPLLNAAILFLLLCFIVGRVRTGDTSDPKAQALYPIKATVFLAQVHPQGHVFHEFLWGGYMIWHLRDWPVFVDSRVDIFEYNGTFKDYLDIIRIHNTIALLDKYRIQYVLYEKDSPLIYLLKHSGGWKTDYADDRVILLEREPAQDGTRGGQYGKLPVGVQRGLGT